MTTLICSDCGQELETTEFFTENNKRGYSNKCKTCIESFTDYKQGLKKETCNWCFGYGVFAFDKRPLGIHEVKRLFPAKDCPVCQANYQDKKVSVILGDYNPKYPW